MRLSSIEEFVAQTRARILHADARLVLIDPDLAPFVVPEPGDPPMHGWEDLQPGAGHATAADWVRPAADLARCALPQFTSEDRKSVGRAKRGPSCVDLGGSRISTQIT